MAVVVVQLFEVIDVAHQDRERTRATPGAQKLDREHFVDKRRVRRPVSPSTVESRRRVSFLTRRSSCNRVSRRWIRSRRDQLPKCGDVHVAGPGVEHPSPTLGIVPRQEDDRGGRNLRLLPQDRQQLRTVEAGELQSAQDDVDALVEHDPEPREAIRGLDDLPEELRGLDAARSWARWVSEGSIRRRVAKAPPERSAGGAPPRNHRLRGRFS